jgi:putative ATP-dependent endonuclease of the OLD family
MDGFKENSEGNSHRRYLQKYLDATKSSMFFARRVILVEGISEQILIPVFLKLDSEKTLDRIGCNLVNVNGVAFKHFLEIIKNGYFIKCVVLTDSDRDKATENRAPKLKKQYEKEEGPIRVEINEDTFEKELIEANKTGKGRDILLKTLSLTRPIKGKEYKIELGQKDIDTEEFFSLIEEYKSEFAFDLSDILAK